MANAAPPDLEEKEHLIVIQTLADALEKRGYDTLTPVQEAVTQPELGDADLLVSAQTGSGKTVGFGLAIASTLLGEETRFGPPSTPIALAIAPTRELALQVKAELSWLYGETGAVVTSCVGGMDPREERRALSRGAHIVVGTPGRLRDHIERNALDMTDLRAVVLDEADEMLDLGFREDLEFILGQSPDERRTLLFSATVPRGIVMLAKRYQRDAVRVTTTAEKSQHSDIEYRALSVAARDSEAAVINVLRYYEAQNALVFCNTRAMVNRLTTRFSNRGFAVVALSGELTQTERSHALQAMRDGRAKVCVATDVAARGIDLPNLELVVHAELPTNSETLLHRSGRTGRAGRKGVSVLIVAGSAGRKAERLLNGAKVRAEWAAPPSADEVLEQDEIRLLADPSWAQEIDEGERGFVEKLTGLHSAEQIAAAYIRLHRARKSAPEEISVRPVKAPDERGPKTPRVEFGPSVWFSVSVGRADNAEVRWVLPMVCRSGNLTRDDIGAIRLQQNETFVEILEASVPKFLETVGPDMKMEAGVTLTRLEGAPNIAPPPRRDAPPRKPYGDKSYGDKGGDRGPRPPRKEYGDKPRRNDDDRPRKPYGDKPERKPYADKPDRPAYKDKPKREDRGDKPAYAKKPKSDWNPDKSPSRAKPEKPAPERKGGYEPKPKAEYGAKPDKKRFAGDPTDTSSSKRRGAKEGGKKKAVGKPAKPKSAGAISKSRRPVGGDDVPRRKPSKG